MLAVRCVFGFYRGSIALILLHVLEAEAQLLKMLPSRVAKHRTTCRTRSKNPQNTLESTTAKPHAVISDSSG